jgi:predicted DnaQ family exonuclease/DinG family helicase
LKKLLTHIGLDDFLAISVVKERSHRLDRSHIEVSRFRDFSVRPVFSGKSHSEIPDILTNESYEHPWVVFDTETTMDSMHSLYDDELAPEIFSSRQIWDVSELSKILFPVLSEYSVERLAELTGFSFEKNNTSSDKLVVVFLHLIEHLARFELKKLSLLARFTEQTHSPFRIIFKKIADYHKTGSALNFQFKKIVVSAGLSNVIGEGYSENSNDSPQPVLLQSIQSVFEHGGLLNAHFENYEERPQQIKLASAIAEAFNSSQFVLAEAGTGTGKSLAYLVPAIYWSSQNRPIGESVVISTHTKNLQEQLFYKDIPQLRKILPIPFRAVLLKGRSNYICIKKWKVICMDPAGHLSPSEREKALPILSWAELTQTGDISECTGFQAEQNIGLWNKLASESSYCQAQKCNSSDECFVKTIRDAARKAHVTVVNHSLLFSDIVSENAILGDYTNLIIDEAHHVEKTAQNYLGIELSLWTIKNFVASLYERDKFESGALLQLKQKTASSRLNKAESSGFNALLAETTLACTEFWIKTQELFVQLAVEASRETADFTDEFSSKNKSREQKTRYDAKSSIIKKADDQTTVFFESWKLLDQALLLLTEAMADWKQNVFEDSDTLRELLILKRDELKKIMAAFQFLSDAKDPDYVYWFERPAKERSHDIRFYAVPLNIAEILRTKLFEKLNTCVFSSATLSIAGNFSYFKSRSGLAKLENVQQFSVGSPFDFTEQCLIIVPSFLPDPSSKEFTDAGSELIEKIILEFSRGTLALFTSYAMMNKCYRDMKRRLKNRSINLLMQGQDGSRTHVTQRFFDDRSSVLFGTDSFWEGVDVPGESLEILIITKLPFEVPSDPLVAAKMERVNAQGGNSFFDYSVPEAVIKFKQGFGRLIRSRSDRGVVLILDNRVVTKAYGSLFLKSLPVEAATAGTEEVLIREMRDFFSIVSGSLG